MSAEIHYPYIQTGGILLSEIMPRGQVHQIQETVTGNSGREIMLRVSPREITIQEASKEADYWMYAKIDISRHISFDLHTRRTKHKDNQPFEVHPDFFAGMFIGVAIDHFEKTGGVNGLAGKWHQGGTNFDAFMETYLQSNNKVKAALSTWSGKTYARYGFGAVTESNVFMHLDDDLPTVQAIFKKEQ